MSNNLSAPPMPKDHGKLLKFVLLGFVFISICVAIYKMLPCCNSDKATTTLIATADPASFPAQKVKTKVTPVPLKTRAGKTAEAKTALVYYFYTNTRCFSCKTIEEYTREAVEKNFAADYKGWKVVFKGINIDDESNAHFKQDYWLNTKSVVVQKFSGDKPLKWARLEKVWQLLDDKDAFINYVTDQTYKLLDKNER